jgi:hypothetical protein
MCIGQMAYFCRPGGLFLSLRRELGAAVASIHRAAEKGCSRKPIFSPANRYALRPEQRAIVCPARRGEQHNM